MIGRVIHGYRICLEVENIPQNEPSSPAIPVIIADAGILSEEQKLTAE